MDFNALLNRTDLLDLPKEEYERQLASHLFSAKFCVDFLADKYLSADTHLRTRAITTLEGCLKAMTNVSQNEF
jgi:hypothetical protein